MGGFASGELLAGGPLQAHEKELLYKLGLPPDEKGRAALNAYFVSDAGLDTLREFLQTGRYRIEVPEEGTLLIVAWLLAHGAGDRAREVLDEVGPWFGRLRFFPVPNTRVVRGASAVHVQTVDQTLREIAAIRESTDGLAQREALSVWAPLFDEMVDLFLETVEGPPPTVATSPSGAPLKRADSSWDLSGGWPCQRYPEAWSERARGWLAKYKRLRTDHRRCRRPELPKKNFSQLRGYLERCAANPRALTGRDVGRIRMILAQVAAKRGAPRSSRCLALRESQAREASRPLVDEVARILAHRLATHPGDAGLDALEPAVAPVTTDESARFGVPAGSQIPERLRPLLFRCLDAAPDVLIREGAIPSSDTLARVVPQLTSRISAAGIDDPDLGRLFSEIYQAFRRRRSLLLLNLASQVKIDELPWVAAIAKFRTDRPESRQAARAMLEQVVLLALNAFPYAILPNKLLQEIRALAERAGVKLAIVDEVAADIFMGEFTEKYLRAAQQAGHLLRGSLYERYYGISYEEVLRIDDVTRPVRRAPTSQRFLELCSARAGDGGSWIARNGAIIEQEQILTTHNLAVLVDGLGLSDSLRPDLPELARRCFTWICQRQQLKYGDWRARLHMVKNTAYAWRQMILFLSLVPAGEIEAFLAWAQEHFARQRSSFQSRFRPALAGLALAIQGGSLDAPPKEKGVRRFLGWATKEHWLLGT
jgi:hypothetical protein